MPELDKYAEQVIRETAYFIWEREGRPEGNAQDHWERATIETFGGDGRGCADEFLQERKRSLPGDQTRTCLHFQPGTCQTVEPRAGQYPPGRRRRLRQRALP
jgi:Protein of unknown function (DUF2934)